MSSVKGRSEVQTEVQELRGRLETLERSRRAGECRLRLWRSAGVVLVVAAALILSPQVGQAQDGNQAGGLPALEKRVAALEAKVGADATRIAALEAKAVADATRIAALEAKADADATRITALEASVATQSGQISALQNALSAEVTARTQADANHNNVLKWFSVTPQGAGADIRITGANLQIVNGAGLTDQVNGFGNLIVGYNELRNNPNSSDVRTGSHNIIAGMQNNYASFGGIVGGLYSSITAPFASVTGGLGGTASGFCASVTGGRSNQATGESASVTGGYNNLADGWNCSVVGGQSNRASASVSCVTAGYFNVADGGGASVTGGQSNRASGGPSSVSGGYNRKALDWGTWRAGTLSATP